MRIPDPLIFDSNNEKVGHYYCHSRTADKVLLYTLVDNWYIQSEKFTIEEVKNYCKEHGYTMQELNEEGIPINIPNKDKIKAQPSSTKEQPKNNPGEVKQLW